MQGLKGTNITRYLDFLYELYWLQDHTNNLIYHCAAVHNLYTVSIRLKTTCLQLAWLTEFTPKQETVPKVHSVEELFQLERFQSLFSHRNII